jgi:uncharacterized protein YndB with AHSA1/START domain
MTMPQTSTHDPASRELLVKKSLFVAAPPERCFEVFTREIASWWPFASHHIGKVDAATVLMEPFVGGRWFEKGVDGSECDWGHVQAWDPPSRLVVSWEINAQWQADPSMSDCEVEVRFTREGTGTRVDLEHRKLHAFGERAAEMHGVFDGERGGWTTLLSAFASAAAPS